MRGNYLKTKWIDNKTPVNAANLNNIENGISDLYNNAISPSEVVPGDGINVNITQDRKLEFSVQSDVMRSTTCSGIEFITSELEQYLEGILYILLDTETNKIKKLIINGTVIYEVE